MLLIKFNSPYKNFQATLLTAVNRSEYMSYDTEAKLHSIIISQNIQVIVTTNKRFGTSTKLKVSNKLYRWHFVPATNFVL